MEILKSLYTVFDKTAGVYRGYHLETEVAQITDFASGVKNVMSDDMISKHQYYYERNALPTSDKTKVTVGSMALAINGKKYTLNNAVDLALSASSAWDSSSSSYVTAENRKGKDFYVYACEPTEGTSVPKLVLSANSSVPTGFTAVNSRKIGGFHCECADVGTIDGHALSGYAAGDILPASIWDLIHRPQSDPEGMVYDDISKIWMDIYGDSWDGTKLVSVFNGVWANGSSAKKWHGEASLEQLMTQGKRLPWRHEFQMAAKGSNEQTNIKGSADPNTTGGHVDTAGRRMVSNIGLEDCCGVLWQWCMDLGFAGGSGWNDSVYESSVDSRRYGQTYGGLYRLLVGGDWSDGASCGSRAAYCSDASSAVWANCGCRGASEPLHRQAEERRPSF